MESYVDLSRTKWCVASVQEEIVVAATSSQQGNSLLSLVVKLINQVKKLEKGFKEPTGEIQGSPSRRSSFAGQNEK